MINNRNISAKTYDLIRLFKNESNITIKPEVLIERIEALASYEYVYFLSEILLEININKEILKVLFSFNMDDIVDDLVDHISFRKPFLDLSNFESLFEGLDVVDRVFRLLHFKNTFLREYESYLYDINSKLSFLKGNEDIPVLSKVVDRIIEDPTDEYFPNYVLYKNEQVSVFDKIKEGLSLYFSYSNFNIFYQINDRLALECKRAEILVDYSLKVSNYNYQMLFPLINSIDDWKKQIANDLISDSESFEKRKLFYKECLNEYQRRTNQDYVRQIINQSTIIKKEGIYEETADVFTVNKLKKWIDQTFSSFGRIKDLDLISIVDELPSKNKIVVSSDFSQPVLLNVLVKFFDSLNLELNTSRIDMIKGFVSNFIVFKETVHHKKYVEKIQYSKIDFVPQESYKDFIKIFLILHHPNNGIIISNITNTRELLTTLFYSKEKSQGLSYESIRRIKNLELSKELGAFKSYFRSILSSLTRDYFLP